jgi:hypothetical protein
MTHLRSVEMVPDGTSHWIAEGPRGIVVDWTARVIEDIPGEYISWSSLPDSKLENAGSIHFSDAGENGTALRLKTRYVPPGMNVGFAIAKVMSMITQAEVADDMRRFKHFMETGVDISTEGQPAGPEDEGAAAMRRLEQWTQTAEEEPATTGATARPRALREQPLQEVEMADFLGSTTLHIPIRTGGGRS